VNPADHAELLLIGKHSILTSTARLRYIEDEDDWSVSGDPTEASMLVFGKKIGFDREALLHEYQPIQEIPFSTERGTHVVVHENGPQHVVSIAGIPEVVVRQAKYIYEGGKKVELSENHRRLSS